MTAEYVKCLEAEKEALKTRLSAKDREIAELRELLMKKRPITETKPLHSCF